jgi:hypothetical protein
MEGHDHVAMVTDLVQRVAGALPPGGFLVVLRLLTQMTCDQMMPFHHAAVEGNLLSQPAGAVVAYAQSLIR